MTRPTTQPPNPTSAISLATNLRIQQSTPNHKRKASSRSVMIATNSIPKWNSKQRAKFINRMKSISYEMEQHWSTRNTMKKGKDNRIISGDNLNKYLKYQRKYACRKLSAYLLKMSNKITNDLGGLYLFTLPKKSEIAGGPYLTLQPQKTIWGIPTSITSYQSSPIYVNRVL